MSIRDFRNGKSLADLFAQFEDSDDLDAVFVKQILEAAAAKYPELPELIRACAIPRWFNAEIVGVLRGTPDDADANRRFLGLISDYGFVLPRRDGGFAYHDNTRDALLVDWRSTEDKRDRFTSLNLSLADFHRDRYAVAVERERYLNEASPVMKSASPRRFKRLSAAVQAEMTSTLLDALYHHLLASTEGGVDFFRTLFHQMESDHLAICQSLISFTRDYLERLPRDDADPTLLAWMDYHDARISRRTPPYDYDRLEGTLLGLVERDDLPADLQVWALDDLARVYESRGDMQRAVSVSLELTTEKNGVDVYNEPLHHNVLGDLYGRLSDREAAMAQYELAIEKSEGLPGARLDTGVTARLGLGDVHAELGEWSAAFQLATEALYLARTQFADDRSTQLQVATGLMNLLAAYGLPAAATAAAESMALLGTPEQRRALLLEYVWLLTAAGRLRLAETILDQVANEAGNPDGGSSPDLDLLIRQAAVLQHCGRELEANTVYSRIIDETTGKPDGRLVQAFALNNRGVNRAVLGDMAGARADLHASIDHLRATGFEVLSHQAQLDLADVLRRTDNLAGAKKLLVGAEAVFPTSASAERARLLLSWGDLCDQQGDWDGARGHYEQALAICTARRDLVEQGRLLSRLLIVSSKQSDWPASLDFSRRATETHARLAAADTAHDSKDQQAADQRNADGIRRFCAQINHTGMLDQARELFRSATELDPANFWPQLNLCFTCAELEDWPGAISALTRALELCPPPMRTLRLHRCLRDYALRQTEELRRQGDLQAAAALSAETLDRLTGLLPADDLTEARTTHCVLLALIEETNAARTVYRNVLRLDGLESPDKAGATRSGETLGTAMAAQLHDAGEWWKLEDALAGMVDDQDMPPLLADALTATRTVLLGRLDELFGLSTTPSIEAGNILVVTPVAVEVGDAIVPFVDSRQDGDEFLYDLIPAMRERILTQTGVKVPGVRMRGTTQLGPTEYLMEIDEVPMPRDTLNPAASHLIRAVTSDRLPPDEGLGDFHPRTGETGLWLVVEDAHADRAERDDKLSAPLCLIHRIESVLRHKLATYLGTQDVADLLEGWKEADADLVASVVSDELARLRLTWLLRSLVRESVPITEWRSLLTAVREAGGTLVSLYELTRATRLRLREALPGNQAGRKRIRVPVEYQAALLAPTPDPRSKHDFGSWLREQLALTGPWMTLVASSEARPIVSALARTEEPIVGVLSSDELIP